MSNKQSDIYVTKSYLPPKEEYMELISQIWDSHQLTNMGPMHCQLEEQLATYLKVPYILAFSSGHMALEMAIQGMEFPEGSEVITTPFTFASTTHAIVRNRLKPVFCDVREDNFTLNPEQIEGLITEKTVAIVPVHVYGQICDVERIQEIADKHGLKVIYDAAHAFGELKDGVGVGNFGHASAYSFHATKPFHTIEGGAVAVKNYNYGVNLYQLKNFGIMGEDMVNGVGGNAKMSEFHAAMGLCNLKHFEEITSERKRVVELYRKHLEGVKGIRFLPPQEHVVENYAYFPILVDEKAYGMDRDGLYQLLEENHIHPRRYFYPLTKDFFCYQGQFEEYHTPVASYASEHVLTLPLYDSLADEDVERICNIISNGAN